MRKPLYVLIPLFIALVLRLYPYATTGQPFSTDAWSPIRNTELLIQHTPIPLTDKIFDGYNNYWPANSIFGAIISETTGLPPIQAMPLFFPIIGAAAILIFFVIVRRLFNTKIAFIASIIAGAAFSNAFFTAAVTKETYASPIILTLFLLFLHPKITQRTQILLFTITSVTLALTHHLTALFAILILTTITAAKFIENTKNGTKQNLQDLLLVFIASAIIATDYVLFAQAGMAMPLTISEWLSIASYQLITFAAAAYLTFGPYKQPKTKTYAAIIATVAALAILSTVLSINVTIVPTFTPAVQTHVLLYTIPFSILLPVVALGYFYQKTHKTTNAPLFWLASLMGLLGYAILSDSAQSITLWIRTPDFLFFPVGILAAAGIYWAYKITGKPLQKLIKPAALALILGILSINVYTMYASVTLQDRYMGYQWVTRTQEFTAGQWITATNNNQTIAGDIKIYYLMHDYFNQKVDTLQGYRYLTNDTQTQPQILFIYNQMQQNGYALGLHGQDLPQNWTQQTTQLNMAYTNGETTLYTGENTK